MSRTFVRQDTQIRNSDAYTDTLNPGTRSDLETTATNIEEDLNGLRSVVNKILLNSLGGNWYDDIPSFSNLDGETKQRGLTLLNSELDALEVKRVLCRAQVLTDITVTAAQNWEILTVASSEAPTQVSAIGAGTDRGAVTALSAFNGGAFAAHELVEVAGTNAISPKNLVTVRDSTTGQIIQSSGRDVYGLLQSESTATSGTAFDDVSTGDRVKISFVRLNATLDDLEAVPVGDIAGTTINYAYVIRDRFEDFPEDCFLPNGNFVDQSTAVDVTRQRAYDNQGTTVVTTTVNHTLDLGSGTTWEIGDLASAPIFQLIEGSGGGTTQFNIPTAVDEFDVDAILNNFNAGISARTGGTRPIDVGVTDGVIESTAGDLRIAADPDGTAELLFDDSNQTGSTWAQTDGIKLSETTAEWDLFETNFGEVSLLNAINQAANASGTLTRDKCVAVVTGGNHAADTNMSGTTATVNLDANLCDYSSGTVTFVDDVDIYLNGVLMRNGADASANHDVYPGTSAADGDIRFEFTTKGAGPSPDVITMMVWDPGA